MVSGQQFGKGKIALIVELNDVGLARVAVCVGDHNPVNDMPQFLIGNMVGQLMHLNELIEPYFGLFGLDGPVASAQHYLMEVSVDEDLWFVCEYR